MSACRVTTMLVRPGSGRPSDSYVLRPMMMRMPHRQRLEPLEIGRQSPRQLPAAADHAAAGHGDDQGKGHRNGMKRYLAEFSLGLYNDLNQTRRR